MSQDKNEKIKNRVNDSSGLQQWKPFMGRIHNVLLILRNLLLVEPIFKIGLINLFTMELIFRPHFCYHEILKFWSLHKQSGYLYENSRKPLESILLVKRLFFNIFCSYSDIWHTVWFNKYIFLLLWFFRTYSGSSFIYS